MAAFLIWGIGLGAILVFCIVWLVVSSFNRLRNEQSPSERATGRRILQGLAISGGTIIAAQNLMTLVWPQPHDFVPLYVHISLIVLGVAALTIGAILTSKELAESKRYPSKAADDHPENADRLDE